MRIFDTEDFYIRCFKQSDKEKAERFAKWYNAEIFQNKNEKTGKLFVEEHYSDETGKLFIDDYYLDAIVVKYPKTGKKHLFIYNYLENKNELHIDCVEIVEKNESYITFRGGDLASGIGTVSFMDYGLDVISLCHLNEVSECKGLKKLSIVTEEYNENLAENLINIYCAKKVSNIEKTISELKNEKDRYSGIIIGKIETIMHWLWKFLIILDDWRNNEKITCHTI